MGDWSEGIDWAEYVRKEAIRERYKEMTSELFGSISRGLDSVKFFFNCNLPKSGLRIRDVVNGELSEVNGDYVVYETPFLMSVLKDKFEVAEYLLSHGADINYSIKRRYGDRYTALGVILNEYKVNENENRIKFLIEHGANYNGSDLEILKLKQQALFLKVVKKGDLEKIRQCLADGANAHTANYLKNETVLMIACEKGNYEVALTLISAGADINAKDKNGKSVLNYAAEGGNTKIMELLLARGAK